MLVELAGYNVDSSILSLVKDHLDDDTKHALTPETLSAAYARLSRDPASIGTLREQARKDVNKARKSNENIVFGYGHASIAEHAVLNIDVMEMSRLCVEAVQHSRLCSYTEKSQRYQKLKGDFVIPKEIEKAKLKEEFIELVELQNKTYTFILGKLISHLKDNRRDEFENLGSLRSKAKEDARYVTSLATEAQFGLTINGRNLEAMIRRLSGHSLSEARRFANYLCVIGKSIIPSLVQNVDCQSVKLSKPSSVSPKDSIYWCVNTSGDNVVLLQANGTDDVYAALFHNFGIPAVKCYHRYDVDACNLVKDVFKSMDQWSPAPRCFELLDFLFEVSISAACFGQLKRHRMSTILSQDYDLSLGVTVPPLVEEAGLEDEFNVPIEAASELYHKFLGISDNDTAAAYLLTQAHKRRVLVKMNARELYAFARLRMDCHAQWDIRNIACHMVKLAKEASPLIMMLVCGKDKFDELKSEVVG
jgi:thymidylate synthase ThyX